MILGTWSEPFEILPLSQRPANSIIFRPHVAYNEHTQMWVLWLRWLPALGPELSDDPTLYLTAVSPTLDGEFKVVNKNVSMYYSNSADDNLFVDDDGTGYLVHNARSSGTKISVDRLTVSPLSLSTHTLTLSLTLSLYVYMCVCIFCLSRQDSHLSRSGSIIYHIYI